MRDRTLAKMSAPEHAQDGDGDPHRPVEPALGVDRSRPGDVEELILPPLLDENA